LLQVGAGTGLVFLLRWYWYRVNAWSEIAAMVASAVLLAVVLLLKPLIPEGSTWKKESIQTVLMAISALLTTGVWLAVTFLTKPAEMATLRRFWEKVKPAGPGWKPVRAQLPPDMEAADDVRTSVLGILFGVAFVYAALFGTGSFIYGRYDAGCVWAGIFLVAGTCLALNLKRSASEE
jgi:hypothetical protein